MNWVWSTILLLIYCLMLYQDFKYRGITKLIFPVLFGIQIYLGIKHWGSKEYVEIVSVNLMILIVQLGVMLLYYKIRGCLLYTSPSPRDA